MPKNVKGGTLWNFLNVHSDAKYQKLEGRTLWRHKKILRKKSLKAEIPCTKIFGQG